MKTNFYNSCKVCGSKIKLINNKYNLHQCDSCELIFCANYFKQEELISVYNKLYNEDNAIYSRHSNDEYLNMLNGGKLKIGYNRKRLISKFIKPSHSVLEIGSGVGLIGTYLDQKFNNISYTGIELDYEAYSKSKKLNLNTYHGDYTIMDGFTKEFDVIVLWEVMEHLQDLDLFLKLSNKKLKDGGLIIFSTPNYNRLKNYTDGRKEEIYQDTPPVHLNFFTLNNTEKILEIHGFKSVNCKVKKLPYLEPFNKKYYFNVLKALTGNYFGATIYYVGKLKK